MEDKDIKSQDQESQEPQNGDASLDEGTWDVISFSEEDAEHADDDIASALAALGEYGIDEDDPDRPKPRLKKKPVPVEKPLADDAIAPETVQPDPDLEQKFTRKIAQLEEKYQVQIRQMNATLRSLHSKLDLAESALLDEKKKADEHQDRYVRVSADYQNYQKRSKAKLNEFIELEQMKLFRSIIPIIDNIRRALNHSESSQGLREGVELIYKQFCDLLLSNKITEIPALDEMFDPTVHDAIDRRSDTNFPDNKVLELFSTGYLLGSRVLKPAQVVVNYLPQNRIDKSDSVAQSDPSDSCTQDSPDQMRGETSTAGEPDSSSDSTSC